MVLRSINWAKAWRVIASRYPPIDLFERLTEDTAVWESLIALEQLTNPRQRQEAGEISLVPPDQRVSGAGASYVMASFTHLNPNGSRFSDGTFGVYYAGAELKTAIAETIYHFEAFARAAHDPARREDMRVLVGTINAEFDDVAKMDDDLKAKILDPNSYAASQAFAKNQRAAGSKGLCYPSVRHIGGTCIGAFMPKAVGLPHQERHLQYSWNGTSVDRYFDYQHDCWYDWPT